MDKRQDAANSDAVDLWLELTREWDVVQARYATACQAQLSGDALSDAEKSKRAQAVQDAAAELAALKIRIDQLVGEVGKHRRPPDGSIIVGVLKPDRDQSSQGRDDLDDDQSSGRLPAASKRS